MNQKMIHVDQCNKRNGPVALLMDFSGTRLHSTVRAGVKTVKPSTDAMHCPAGPSSQTQIPAQRNQYPSGLHHTAATCLSTSSPIQPSYPSSATI